jgi:beta-1,4-N-acetylglucosaminyltransferase
MALLILAITLASTLVATVCLILLRLRVVLDPERPKSRRQRCQESTHLLIVLGSGGHSAEMIGMLERAVREDDECRRLEWRDYTYRTWVVGKGDRISARRAKEFEEMVEGLQKEKGEANGKVEHKDEARYRIVTVPRAREIHQSAFTAPISCFRCMLACWTVLLPSATNGLDIDAPDLILCTGPATATILVFTSILLRFFDVRGCDSRGKVRTVYVESWARVKKLSLSGKLMVHVVDRFFVQWPQLLKKTGGRGEYLGVLV